MKKIIWIVSFCILFINSFGQKPTTTIKTTKSDKPKLVVGVVIDQMRWDYLYRFANFYSTNGGFKRMMNEGFSCQNTLVPYLSTVTGCGHACVYTGTVPSIHGITGNNWYDNRLHKMMYCVEDKTVATVGSNNEEVGQMSPLNVWSTTITDELKLANNFNNKVIGISMKDRGAIIPAGHAPDGAYWYDGQTGNFVTSTYYKKQLPNWVEQFNQKKWVDSFYTNNWNLSLPLAAYQQNCDSDRNEYEAKPFGNKQTGFPYNLDQYVGKDYKKITVTPFANDLLLNLAKAAIQNEALGQQSLTDFLTISFSSPDYVGHSFGPNSWEMMDTYKKLDETLGKLLDFLDKSVGKNQYVLFLTADHAGAHIPEYLDKHHIPAGRLADEEIKSNLNIYLKQVYNQTNLINSVAEYDIYLNHYLIDSFQLDISKVKKTITEFLLQNQLVLTVVDKSNAASAPVPFKLREMIVNGYTPTRSGDLQIINKSGVMDAGGKTGMSHGAWNMYDSHIPLLWYGKNIPHGITVVENYMTDIAPTLAALLQIQMPSGTIGKPIPELFK